MFRMTNVQTKNETQIEIRLSLLKSKHVYIMLKIKTNYKLCLFLDLNQMKINNLLLQIKAQFRHNLVQESPAEFTQL